jgi:GTP-binding protein HflX
MGILLIHVNFSEHSEEDLLEFVTLAQSSGAHVLDVLTTTRKNPDPKYFIGTGKAEEIKTRATELSVGCVIFNHSLSPSQQRNLELLFKIHVLDRTQLILNIFAQRARTYEGKLQVDLAQLQHQSTRLVRGWTHLERQKGGIGVRGGPGETQLEVDRRLIRAKIKTITKRLEKVRQQREQGRRKRQSKPAPVISLVGYTNAGKSTLFNSLTDASVYAADQLFATLDPTLRRISLPEVGEVIIADTVGFIRHLPHDLIEAFRATLEEIREADLLLHVIDASDPRRAETIAAVEAVLQEIGAEQVPQIRVFNKIDLLADCSVRVEAHDVWLAAQQNKGLELLKAELQQRLSDTLVQVELTLGPNQGGVRAKLYDLNAIVHESMTQEGGWQLTIRLPDLVWQKMCSTLR